MKKITLLMLLAILFVSFSLVMAQDMPLAVFVVADAGAPNNADLEVGDNLEEWGFEVVWLSANETVPEDADGAAVVIISSTTLSSDVGSKFTQSETGVLTWEGGMYDDLLMCSGPAWGNSTMNTDIITIMDSTHPMAAGLENEVVVVSEIPQEFTIIKMDSLIESGIQVATIFDDLGEEHTAIVGFEKGAIMVDGTEAAGRRCGFFMRDNTATVLTEDGWLLLKAAVMWTAGMEETGVDTRGAQLPESTRLLANYPNPFNPSTTIPFLLSRQADVQVDVYDAMGRHIRSLVNQEFSAGQHQVVWNGLDQAGESVSSGIYFVKMNASESESVQKILLTK